ncbi:unknown [Bacteroides sp. CAG:598]|nr:unknown [Bacteroides sp. CAG:598]
MDIISALTTKDIYNTNDVKCLFTTTKSMFTFTKFMFTITKHQFIRQAL